MRITVGCRHRSENKIREIQDAKGKRNATGKMPGSLSAFNLRRTVLEESNRRRGAPGQTSLLRGPRCVSKPGSTTKGRDRYVYRRRGFTAFLHRRASIPHIGQNFETVLHVVLSRCRPHRLRSNPRCQSETHVNAQSNPVWGKQTGAPHFRHSSFLVVSKKGLAASGS